MIVPEHELIKLEDMRNHSFPVSRLLVIIFFNFPNCNKTATSQVGATEDETGAKFFE